MRPESMFFWLLNSYIVSILFCLRNKSITLLPPSINTLRKFLFRKKDSISSIEYVEHFILLSCVGESLRKVKFGNSLCASDKFLDDLPHNTIGAGICLLFFISCNLTFNFGLSLNNVFFPITIQSADARRKCDSFKETSFVIYFDLLELSVIKLFFEIPILSR